MRFGQVEIFQKIALFHNIPALSPFISKLDPEDHCEATLLVLVIISNQTLTGCKFRSSDNQTEEQ
jgi:hypothetical protein